jgi:peroxiredoxin
MPEFTTKFSMSFKKATTLANYWSKNLSIIDDSTLKYWRKEYNTAIKGEPMDANFPNLCWAVTNKFDPRIRRGG